MVDAAKYGCGGCLSRPAAGGSKRHAARADPLSDRNALGRHGGEGLPGGGKGSIGPGKRLPAPHGDIDIYRVDLDGTATTTNGLAGHNGRARAREWLVNRIPGLGKSLGQMSEQRYRLGQG